MELVARCFPPGPDRAHLRSLCRLTRGLTNTCVTVAKVKNWKDAERLGTRFPHLQQLEVGPYWNRNQHQHARNFLQHSAAQLTKLTSLDMAGGSLDMIQLLCNRLPQLQRLQLAGQCRGDKVRAMFQDFAALQDVEDLALQVTYFSFDWQIRYWVILLQLLVRCCGNIDHCNGCGSDRCSDRESSRDQCIMKGRKELDNAVVVVVVQWRWC